MKTHIAVSVSAAAAALALLLSGSACAQEEFIVSTAAVGNTYDLMAQQLAAICKNEISRPIVRKLSNGSMDNLDRLVNNEVSAAIVQTDVLHFRTRREDLGRIKALFALHPEEVHVLALSETRRFGGLPGIGSFSGFGGTPFKSLADLRERKVGAWGGSLVTAQQIRLQAETDFQLVELADDAAAVKALLDKSVDAVISVGGSPQPWVQRLDARFRLVPITDVEAAKLKGIYRPAVLSYGALKQNGVPTVATDAILVVRDYKTPGLSAMSNQTRTCFRHRLAELQETPGNHASWQKVVLDTEPNWPSYAMPAATPTPTLHQPTKRTVHVRGGGSWMPQPPQRPDIPQ